MSDTKKMDEAAAEAGYEIAHGQESYGEHFFGLRIYVRMSNRCLIRDRDDFRDQRVISRAAEDLRRGLETVTAQLDPKGPGLRAAYRADIERVYRDAGVTSIYVEELPNDYCKEPCCLNRPWFRVTSSIGHVVIGWRKRVLSIDWKDSIVKASGAALFPKEDVTRSETGIHAWSLTKATEYVRRLHAPDAAAMPGRCEMCGGEVGLDGHRVFCTRARSA